MQLSKKKKLVLTFFLYFWHLHQILHILKETKPSQLIYFRNYGLQKKWLDKSLKSSISGHRLTVNMPKCPRHCWNLHCSSFIIFYHHYEGKKLENVSFGDIWNLRLFVNILTANHKYSLCNKENLQESLQMLLSKKQNVFSEFLPVFLKSTSNFKHFERNKNTRRLSQPETTDCGRRG